VLSSLSIADQTLLAVRLFLAGVFLLAGATKLVDPASSRLALRDFGLPSVLARPIAPLLPCLELATSGALVLSSLAWYGAWGALALLTMFMGAIAIAIVRGRRPNCHCFGRLQSAPVSWRTVLRNVVLSAMAGWLVSRGPGQSGPEVWTWFTALDSHGRNVALVLGIVAGLLFLRQVDRSRPQPESIDWSFPLDDDDEEPAAERSKPAPKRPAAPPAVEARPAAEDVQPARRHPLSVGLPIGTPAPEFELPAIDGQTHSLQSLRELGDVLLVFSSPFCESCQTLTSNLVRWIHEMKGLPNVVLINVGTAKQNLAKLAGFDASRVLLQPEFEVAEMYDCGVTPAAVLVGADGVIRSALAVGGPAIGELVSSCAKSVTHSSNQDV
jgi:peroxiredoxin/uncharacterized membrane protein YphA (DoxX/SURF4 family)